jgi:hypothetical protein
MNEFQAAMGQVRDPFAGGPPVGGPPRDQREQMGQLRQRMTNRLSGVLTSEQLARFEQSFGGPAGGPGGEPGGFPGGGSPGAGGGFPGGEGGLPGGGMRPGQVWVLEDGEPRAVRVLVGLSDAQYTEVRSQELADGDAVIVRLAR